MENGEYLNSDPMAGVQEYNTVKLVVENSKSITTFTANKVRTVEHQENYDAPNVSNGFMYRNLSPDLESITFKIKPDWDPVTKQYYQESRIDKTIIPNGVTEARIPLYFPTGKFGESQHVLGMVRIDGDTATIKLLEGETFEAVLASGAAYIGMAIMVNPGFPKIENISKDEA